MCQYWMEFAERQNFFPWFFHKDIMKFHDFSMILAFFSNSMIPGLENAFLIFQVFHDFPGRWEPCDMYRAGLGLFPSFERAVFKS